MTHGNGHNGYTPGGSEQPHNPYQAHNGITPAPAHSDGQTAQGKVVAGLDLSDDSTKWIAGFAIASFVAFIGTFLPWLKATAPFVGTFTVSGIDGDGMIIFGLALFGVGTATFALYHEAGRRLPWRAIPLMVLAALALLVAIFGLLNAASGAGSIREFGGSVSPGFGLILIFLASIGMTVCSVLAFLADKKNNPGLLFGSQGAAFQSGQTFGAQSQPFGTAPAPAYGDQPAAQQHAGSPSGYGAQQYGAAPYAAPNTGTHTAPQNTPNARPHHGSQPTQEPHTPSDSAQAPESDIDTQA